MLDMLSLNLNHISHLPYARHQCHLNSNLTVHFLRSSTTALAPPAHRTAPMNFPPVPDLPLPPPYQSNWPRFSPYPPLLSSPPVPNIGSGGGSTYSTNFSPQWVAPPPTPSVKGYSSISSSPITQQFAIGSFTSSSSHSPSQRSPSSSRFSPTSPIFNRTASPPVPLNKISPSLVKTLTMHGAASCSSCGRSLPERRESVVLVPCREVLCATCLTLLISSPANVPPRPTDCFACGVQVETIEAVDFVDLDASQPAEDWALARAGPSELGFHQPELERSHAGQWPVIRIDNIPWSLTAAQLPAFLPSTALPPGHANPHPIHILIHRSNLHTLNQAYVELGSLVEAKEVVRRASLGATIEQRPVGIGLSSQRELCENVFPRAAIDGELISVDELDALGNQFDLASKWTQRTPERMFLQMASIIAKFPWQRPELYDQIITNKLYSTLAEAIRGAAALSEEDLPDRDEVVSILLKVGLNCSAFSLRQKQPLAALVGLAPAELGSPQTETSSPGSLMTPAVTSSPRISRGSTSPPTSDPLVLSGPDSQTNSANSTKRLEIFHEDHKE